MVETERTPHHSYTSEDEDFNLVFIQSYMFKKIKKPKTSLFPFGNEHLFCKPLLGNFLPHRFLFSPLFCGQQPIEIGFHLFPWNLLCALRAAEGQKGEQRGYSSPGHISWGLQICLCSGHVGSPVLALGLYVHGGVWSCQGVVHTHVGQSLWAPWSVLQKHDGKNWVSQMVLILPLFKWCNFQ